MPCVLFAAPFFTDNATRTLHAVAGVADVAAMPVGVVSQEPAEQLPAPLRSRVAAHWRVADALDAGELVAAAQRLAGTLGPIHRYLGVVEQIQLPLAEARARLDVPGMRAEQARNFRDKARMKARLRAAGLPCARYRLAADAAAAHAFVGEVGYPVILKPPAGAASQATFRADDDRSLRDALEATGPAPDRAVLLEEFVTGDEYSFDAFLHDGRMVFHSITRYDPNPLEVVRNPWIQWTVLLPREIDAPQFDDIRAAGARALAALGLETGMCHMEWFRRRDGSLAISEVAARPPGAQITTLISRAHDFDCLAAWARLMIQDRFEGHPERRYAAGGAYLRGQGPGRVRAVHGLDTIERDLGHLVTDARIPSPGQEPGQTYEGEGYLLVRHPETRVVREALTRIIETVRVEMG